MNSIQASSIPIEDYLEDILGKAIRGTNRNLDTLAKETNLTLEQIHSFLQRETFDSSIIEKIAPILDLHTPSLLKQIPPPAIELSGLEIFNSEWHDMTVNSYLIHNSKTNRGAIFDSGADVTDMLSFIKEKGVQIESIFITHTHNDHIVKIDELAQTLQYPTIHSNHLEPWKNGETFTEGTKFEISGLKIETRTTSGHSIGGTTYLIEGDSLDRPVAIVGDALFALSMGGGLVSYQEALEKNRTQIFTLPNNTVVCPGHGPLTTIEHEKLHNPFYPEFKS